MKTLALAVFLVASAQGCAHVPQGAATCVVNPDLIPTVIEDLKSPDYQLLLEQLVAKQTLCLVQATVDSILNQKAQLDPVVLEHAKAWRAAHP